MSYKLQLILCLNLIKCASFHSDSFDISIEITSNVDNTLTAGYQQWKLQKYNKIIDMKFRSVRARACLCACTLFAGLVITVRVENESEFVSNTHHIVSFFF